MNKIPVIAIFDVGKTNKKLLLFNEQYELVQENSRPMDEITDEDGFPCDDVQALTAWIRESYNRLLSSEQYEVTQSPCSISFIQNMGEKISWPVRRLRLF